MKKLERGHMTIDEAIPLLDAWATDQTATFTARAKMSCDPRAMDMLFGNAERFARAQRGSRKGSAALRGRTVWIGEAVVSALQDLNSDFGGRLWRGDRFLLRKACARIASNVPAALEAAIRSAFPNGAPTIDARRLQSWAKRARPTWKEWDTRNFGAREKTRSLNDPRALAAAERAKRRARQVAVEETES